RRSSDLNRFKVTTDTTANDDYFRVERGNQGIQANSNVAGNNVPRLRVFYLRSTLAEALNDGATGGKVLPLLKAALVLQNHLTGFDILKIWINSAVYDDAAPDTGADGDVQDFIELIPNG